MSLNILSIAHNQTDNIKINNLLNRVEYLNFQLNEIQDIDNISDLEKYHPEIIIWALNERNYNNIILKIKNINDSCNIPLILILTVAESHKYSIADVNYCLLWNEITPALLEKTILYALNQHQIETTAKLKRENLELASELSTIQDLFQTIINNTSTFVWMVDVKGNFTFLNQPWLNFTDLTLTAGLQENWLDRIHPDDIAECKQAYQSAQKECTGFEIEYRLRRFDNEYCTILNTAVYRSNSQGDVGWLCFGLDITRRKKIEQQLIERSRTDRILAKIAKDIYSSLNIDLILQTVANEINQFLLADRVFIAKVTRNRQLNLLFESKLAAASSCEVLNKKLPEKELIDNFKSLSKGAIIAGYDTLSTTIIDCSRSDLTLIPYPLLLVPIVCDRQLWGLICIEFNLPRKYWQQEVKFLEQLAIQLGIAIKQWLLYQQLEQTNKKLAQEVTTDELTKVANRRQFDRYISLEWKRCAREKHPLSLILCDIDYFKLYNDAYGHLLGDRCLKAVAQAIAKVIKRPADLVARYGGEEFAVILPNTNILGAKYIAEQIRAKVEVLKITHIDSKVNDYVTLSTGVACCIPNRESSFTALIEAADRGLYKAKELGRNRVCEFDINKLSNDFSV